MTSMVLPAPDPFLSALLEGLADRPDSGSSGIERMRKEAIAQLQGMTLPTTRAEEWRFTSLETLKRHRFVSAVRSQEVEAEHLQPSYIPQSARMVFVDGHFSPELSDLQRLPEEVVAASLRLNEDAAAFSELPSDVFDLVNAAFLEDGAWISVPKGFECQVPLHLLFVSTTGTEAVASHPRVRVKAGANSSLTVFEEYVSLGEGVNWTNAVTEAKLDGGAKLLHIKLQNENHASIHLGRTYVLQEHDSAYLSTTVTLGAAFSRQEPTIRQLGEGAECSLMGLAMVSEDQFADTHSSVEHLKPYGTSHQLHKCIVDGHGRAVFNGKIMVRPDAQQINSTQASRNLLLSDHARVDTKPQLEIFADDVKCSHGATVGQLDSEELFYLQSRGLGPKEATSLLTYAFAAEVLESIPVPSLKHRLQRLAFALVPEGR